MEPEFKRVKRHPRNTISSYTGTRNTEENILIHKIAPEKDICETIHSSVFLTPRR